MITEKYQKLDIKRRLWMFAESESQLTKTYGYHTDNMIGFTSVRCYMNPAQKDHTAEDVSDMVGFPHQAVCQQRPGGQNPYGGSPRQKSGH